MLDGKTEITAFVAWCHLRTSVFAIVVFYSIRFLGSFAQDYANCFHTLGIPIGLLHCIVSDCYVLVNIIVYSAGCLSYC